MMKLLFIQLPVPQKNIGNSSGNIPLAGHYLQAATSELEHISAYIVPEAIATWYGDAALIDYLVSQQPDILALSLYCWNIERSLYILRHVKSRLPLIAIGGGPEVLPENVLLQDSPFDYLIPGEGEQSLYDLLQTIDLPPQSSPLWLPAKPADAILDKIDLPAMYAQVDSFPSRMLVIESQRGCPYQCGYCYYNNSRSGIYTFATDDIVSIIRNLPDNNAVPIYLLDPLLNSRPDLPYFLRELAVSIPPFQHQLYGEIRAENISLVIAKLYQKAHFTDMEIGLQTTHKPAMKLMNRQTKLMDFAASCKALLKAGISPKIDLIIGLPGDDLTSIKKSIDYIVRHKLTANVQVFPLLVLYGTDFRNRSAELGLRFQPTPPYQIISTPLLSTDDIFAAFAYAEDQLGLYFDPFPELDLCEADLLVNHADCIGKHHFHRVPTDLELSWLAVRLAGTCQLHFYPAKYGIATMQHILTQLTDVNPFGVWEIVLWEQTVDCNLLLQSMQLRRPHWLDKDLRFLYPEPGNRSVTFTAVLKSRDKVFYGEMQRQIYQWTEHTMPTAEEFDALRHLDGIYFDNSEITQDIAEWYFSVYSELPFSFSFSFDSANIQHFLWSLKGRSYNNEILTQGEE